MSRNGGKGGGGWVHLKDPNSIYMDSVVALQLVVTGRATFGPLSRLAFPNSLDSSLVDGVMYLLTAAKM